METLLKIVTLGDSITQATSGRNSYRRDLWNKLAEIGHAIDFVGSENRTQDGQNFPDSNFDPDHEGHWGWRTDEIINGRSGQGKLSDWLQEYTPDIALVHLGSNDVLQNNSVVSTIDELKQTISILRQDNPNVVVFIAQLIPVTGDRNQLITALNAQIPALVDDENSLNSPVILVDQNSGFNPNTDTYDGIHPNESGEAKMAQRWFEALENYFNSSSINNDSPTGAVSLTGSATEDSPLTASNTIADADGLGAISYQWQASSDGTNFSNIPNATSASFTPGDDQVGQQLRVVASYTDDNGTNETVNSTPTEPIINIDDPATVSGDISATGDEYSELTGTLSATDIEGLSDGTLFTIASADAPANGTASIDPATGLWSYTPGANFNGNDAFTVTITDDLGGTTPQAITVSVTPFNGDNYLASNPDLIQVFGYNPSAASEHYRQFGRAEQRNKDSFAEDLYIASNDDLINALGYNLAAGTQHYIQFGFGEGRPTELFHPELYLSAYSDLQQVFGQDLAAATRHYIEFGFAEGRDQLTGFNPGAYIASYEDLREALGYNPDAGRQHYLQNGFNEGRMVTFEPDDYIASNPDLINALGYNLEAAISHYIQYGARENRATDTFNESAYLNRYADLQAAFGNNLAAATQHYIQSGFGEGRTA